MNISKLSDQLSEPSIRKKLLQFLIVSCITPSSSANRISMMPLAPTMTELPTAHKPKIGFSIDSIVGDAEAKDRFQRTSSAEKSPNRPTPPNPTSPEKSKTSLRESSDGMMSPLGHLQKHNHFLHHHLLNSENGIKKESMSPPIPMLLPNHHPLHQLRLPLAHHLSSPSQGSNRSSANYSPGRASPANSNNDNANDSINRANVKKEQDRGAECSNPPSRSPSPQANESPRSNHDIPTSPHEIHRPLVSASHSSPRPGMPGSGPPQSHHPVGPHGLPQFAGYPPGMLNFAAMAAAAAAQSHHHGPHPGIPGWMPPGHSLAPHHHHPAAAAHPLYPWLLAKHSRMFPPRFGPGPDLPGFLFQPFRKPKRIRTAFSPSQLLKLEHAFEKNHYVVGAERKQLAKSLSLSETQVKVWFQNRRTKHKRVEQDDEPMKKSDGGRGSGHCSSGSDHPSSGLSTSADSSTRNYSEEMSDEDEEIVMDEDYSEEEEMENGHHSMHHHLQKSYS